MNFIYKVNTNDSGFYLKNDVDAGAIVTPPAGDFKKFTSKEIIKSIKENPVESRRKWLLDQFKAKEGYTFWLRDNHPIELWSNEVIDQKIKYTFVHYASLYPVGRFGASPEYKSQ